MIASFTFNRQPQQQHAYQQFAPATRLLEDELIKPKGFMPVFMWDEGRVRIQYGRWGMPAQEVAAGEDRLTAHAGNIFQRPAFGESIRLRRCLIPVDGFKMREMMTLDSPEHEFLANSEGLFCLAGIYAYREGAYGEEALGISIVTTDTPLNWRQYSHNMPLVLSPDAASQWIDPATSLNQISNLLQPVPAHWLKVKSTNEDYAFPGVLQEQAA